jgi:YggT family protein
MGAALLSNITGAIADVLHMLLNLYFWLVVANALLSWVNPDPRNPIVQFLHSVTGPVLYQIRRRLPFVYASGIDFSPLVLIIAIQVVDRVVVRSLYQLAYHLAASGVG